MKSCSRPQCSTCWSAAWTEQQAEIEKEGAMDHWKRVREVPLKSETGDGRVLIWPDATDGEGVVRVEIAGVSKSAVSASLGDGGVRVELELSSELASRVADELSNAARQVRDRDVE